MVYVTREAILVAVCIPPPKQFKFVSATDMQITNIPGSHSLFVMAFNGTEYKFPMQGALQVVESQMLVGSVGTTTLEDIVDNACKYAQRINSNVRVALAT